MYFDSQKEDHRRTSDLVDEVCRMLSRLHKNLEEEA